MTVPAQSAQEHSLFHFVVKNSPTGTMFEHKSPINGKLIKFFAENGLIHSIDEEDGDYRCMNVETAMERAAAIFDAATQANGVARWSRSDDIAMATKLLEAIEVAQDQWAQLHAKTRPISVNPGAAAAVAAKELPSRGLECGPGGFESTSS